MHWQASQDRLHAWPGMFPDEGLDKFESKATGHSMLSQSCAGGKERSLR